MARPSFLDCSYAATSCARRASASATSSATSRISISISLAEVRVLHRAAEVDLALGAGRDQHVRPGRPRLLQSVDLDLLGEAVAVGPGAAGAAAAPACPMRRISTSSTPGQGVQHLPRRRRRRRGGGPAGRDPGRSPCRPPFAFERQLAEPLGQELGEVEDPRRLPVEEGLVVELPGPEALGAGGRRGSWRRSPRPAPRCAGPGPRSSCGRRSRAGRGRSSAPRARRPASMPEAVQEPDRRPGAVEGRRPRARGRRRRSTSCSRSRRRPRPCRARSSGRRSSQPRRSCCGPAPGHHPHDRLQGAAVGAVGLDALPRRRPPAASGRGRCRPPRPGSGCRRGCRSGSRRASCRPRGPPPSARGWRRGRAGAGCSRAPAREIGQVAVHLPQS